MEGDDENKGGVLMEYPVAHLSTEAEQKIKQLEQELGVVLVAYDQEEASSYQPQEESMYMDGNINLI